jgi:3D (Asp-Asp-Asp) domain-containing protein
LGFEQGRIRLKGLFAFGSVALAVGYLVPTVGVASGPGTPVAAVLAVPADPAAFSNRPSRLREEARIYDGRVVSFSERLRTAVVAIPFEVRQVADPALPLGVTVVDAPGSEGALTEAFAESLADGVVLLSEPLSQATSQPSARVLRVGTAAAPPPPPLPADPTASSGQAIAGSATSYCLTGRTATGTQAGPGSIAVDPTVIRLGSRLYVPGYGYGTAVDTGGAIKGTLIDVWLTCEAAVQWGRRQLTIYVLAG